MYSLSLAIITLRSCAATVCAKDTSSNPLTYQIFN